MKWQQTRFVFLAGESGAQPFATFSPAIKACASPCIRHCRDFIPLSLRTAEAGVPSRFSPRSRFETSVVSRAVEEHWRRYTLSRKLRPVQAASQAVAGDAAETLDRSDGTREATFSGRLLAEETLSFESLGLDDRVLVSHQCSHPRAAIILSTVTQYSLLICKQL